MSTYTSIKAQIAKLEAQAQSIRAKEVTEVVARIKSEIASYGLTPADLGFAGKGKRLAKVAQRKPGVPKYRDPVSGKTWTGHGKPPNWIKDKDREAFLINVAGQASSRKSMNETVKTALATRGKAAAKTQGKPRAPKTLKKSVRKTAPTAAGAATS